MSSQPLIPRAGVQGATGQEDSQVLRWLTFLELFEGVPQAELELLLEGAEWVAFERGQLVMGGSADTPVVHILRSGSFSTELSWSQTGLGVMARIEPGDLIGALGALSGAALPVRAYAARDSVALRIPEQAFVRFLEASHRGLLRVTRHLNSWLVRGLRAEAPKRECSVVAFVAVSQGLDLQPLVQAMAAYLSKQSLAVELITPANRPATSQMLSAMEAVSDVVFLVTVSSDPQWVDMAIANCDRVVMVQGEGTDLPEPDIERICGHGQRPTVDLVLVHAATARAAAIPPRWRGRKDLDAHLHSRSGVSADTEFLARFLVGRAVGMVFAGGGARGFAHLGVAKAFREAGIPIDMTGGTSMGGIIGAGIASEWSTEHFLDRLHQLFAMSSPVRDYTLPLVSIVRGRMVAKRMESAFGDLDIEQLWRPFFCVSSDLTLGRPHVHRSGLLWRALRASSALPGILPPVISNGHVLVDGAITNNFPVDIMREMARGCVVGSNVPVDAQYVSHMENIELMSTWRLLRDIRSGPVNIFSVMSRTATISSRHQTQHSCLIADYLVESASDDVRLLDWKSLHKVVERSYRSTAQVIERDGVSYASLLSGKLRKPAG